MSRQTTKRPSLTTRRSLEDESANDTWKKAKTFKDLKRKKLDEGRHPASLYGRAWALGEN